MDNPRNIMEDLQKEDNCLKIFRKWGKKFAEI